MCIWHSIISTLQEYIMACLEAEAEAEVEVDAVPFQYITRPVETMEQRDLVLGAQDAARKVAIGQLGYDVDLRALTVRVLAQELRNVRM